MKASFPSRLACVSLLFGLAAFGAHATLIGSDSFSYADGALAGQTGGTGWTYERTDEAGAPAQSPSNWDLAFGNSPNVTSGALITERGGVKREFGGATTGSTFPSNEREGAFQGTGAWYAGVDFRVGNLVAAGINQWAGLSSYDFGTERIFFGMPGQSTATRYFGIQGAFSAIPVQVNTDYRLVFGLDFDNDLLTLWVNPDGADNASSYDFSVVHTDNSWSTAVRLASGGDGGDSIPVTYDNLVVATDFASAVPEPSAGVLALLGVLLLARRRK